MKIHGAETTANYAVNVRLPRPDGVGLELTLQPLPLGFQRRLREHQLAPPIPPTRIARDAQGRPLRQANGQAVLLTDDADADYRAAVELYHQRVAVLAVAAALRGDPHVAFDAQAEDFADDWRPYADALTAELEAAQWAAGDVIWLCRQVCRISNLVEQHLQEAGAAFFPPPRGAAGP